MDFSSKYDQIRGKLWIWSHLLEKSIMENFIFCAVIETKGSISMKWFRNLDDLLQSNPFLVVVIGDFNPSLPVHSRKLN